MRLSFGTRSPRSCRRRSCSARARSLLTVADRDLMLSARLTKRLINHFRPQDVTEGYAADWTMDQLCEAAQKIADRIDELIGRFSSYPATDHASNSCPLPPLLGFGVRANQDLRCNSVW